VCVYQKETLADATSNYSNSHNSLSLEVSFLYFFAFKKAVARAVGFDKQFRFMVYGLGFRVQG